MSLRSFILSISAFIIFGIVGLFYFQSQKILGGAFQDLEKVHLDTVAQTAQSLIDTRKYSLRTYRGLLENNNTLSSVLLVASAHHRSEKIIAKLDEVQKSLKCDLVDFIPFNGKPIRFPELSSREASTWQLRNVNGRLTLLSYSPVRHYGEVIGTLALGYDLNGVLAEEIARTTQTRVRFTEATAKSGEIARPVVIDSDLKANMDITTNFISEVNRSTRTGITWLGIASLFLVMLLISALLEFGFVRHFTELLKSILTVASDLDRGIVGETRAVHHPIKEVNELGVSFAKFSTSLRSFKERIESQSRASAYAEVAEQVAHDLKSPLSALDMMLSPDNLVEIPDNRRNRIQACIQRIKDTLRVLSEKRRDNMKTNPIIEESSLAPVSTDKDKELLSSIVEGIVQEKRIQYRDQQSLQILSQISSGSHFAFVEINANDLKRALSNLIDNSVQAIPAEGKVDITLDVSQSFAHIIIRDSGKGIPAEIMSKIGNRGATFNKEGGSGLGLWWAKSLVEQAHGRFQIQSTPQVGTEIRITLPTTPAPHWFCSRLRFSDDTTVVIIDDDPTIHEMWSEKLSPLGGEVRLVHLKSGVELEKWLAARPPHELKSAFFLFDFELSGESKTGLDWIERYALGEKSVLVTSHYEKRSIRQRAEALRVRLIPKGISGFIPVATGRSVLSPNPGGRDA